MRRSKQQLPDEDALAALDSASHGVLCLLGDEDYPYGVPLSHVRQGNILYFHGALEGHKMDAIRQHDKASYTVVVLDEVDPPAYSTNYRSAIAFGRVRIVEDEEEKRSSLQLLGERYNPGHAQDTEQEAERGMPRLYMLALDIEHITGKESRHLAKERRQAQG